MLQYDFGRNKGSNSLFLPAMDTEPWFSSTVAVAAARHAVAGVQSTSRPSPARLSTPLQKYLAPPALFLSLLSFSSSSVREQSRVMVAARPPTPSRRLSSPRPPPTLQAHSPPPMAPPRIARPPLRPPAYRNRTRRHRPDHPHVELPSPVLFRPNRPSEWVALDLLMLTGLPTAALPRQSTAARRAERRLSLLPPSAPLRSPPTPTERTTR